MSKLEVSTNSLNLNYQDYMEMTNTNTHMKKLLLLSQSSKRFR
ncbi:hypothetical protein BAME_26260 [Bacillus sp. M 2-6]|nr:hypothetical protein BAME_26260 [Bacillus sp. M 2-6]